MEDLSRSMSGSVFSPTGDKLYLGLPIVVAVSVVIVHFILHVICGVTDEMPYWVYIVAVVFGDVGHTFSTLFVVMAIRSDKPDWSSYTILPIISWIVALTLCFVDDTYTWVLLGYCSIVHHVIQQRRLLTLAMSSDPQHKSQSNYYILYATAVLPILVWHTDEVRGFDWFLRSDPLPFVVSEAFLPVLYVGMFIVAAVLIVKSFTVTGFASSNVFIILITTMISWFVGLLLPSPAAGILFIVIPHAIPAYAIDFFMLRNYWSLRISNEPKGDIGLFSRWVSTRPVVFLIAIGILATAEELLWECLIVREWSGVYLEHDLSPIAVQIVTSILLLPQMTHLIHSVLLWSTQTNPGAHALLAYQESSSRKTLYQ